MSEKEKNLLIKLMEIPSISDSESALGNYLIAYLSQSNFDEVERIEVDNNGFNVLATKGKPATVLQAHMDTVSPYIPPSEQDGKIFGRGSCDTKGSMASMITAAELALDQGISDFALLFTVGEENDFRGMEKFVQVKNNWPFAVIGEPTKLKTVNGQYGLLNLNVETVGKRAHTSVPENGINAIDMLLEIIAKLKAIKLNNGSMVTLSTIKGGIQDNIVPDNASALFNFRVSPADKTNYLAEFQQVVDQYEAARLVKGLDLPAILTNLPEKLSFLGETSFVKGGTELSFLKNGIILGPGDMDLAHSDNEFVEIEELGKASQLYLEIIKKMAE